MVAVSTGINENMDFSEVESENQMAEIIWNQSFFLKLQLSNDCRALFRFLERAEAHDWPVYGSRERYIEDGLGLPVQSVDWAAQGLEIVGRNKPVSFEKAKALGRPGGARNIEGRNQYSGPKEEDGHSCNYKKERKPGENTNAEYIAARLARDAETDAVAADVKARYEAGELSAHAAAVEMGWRKQRTQLDKLKSAWRNADEDERAQFEEFINDWRLKEMQ